MIMMMMLMMTGMMRIMMITRMRMQIVKTNSGGAVSNNGHEPRGAFGYRKKVRIHILDTCIMDTFIMYILYMHRDKFTMYAVLS